MIFNSSVSLIYLGCLSLPGPLVDVYHSINSSSQGICWHFFHGTALPLQSRALCCVYLLSVPVSFTKQLFLEVRGTGSFLFIWALLWQFVTAWHMVRIQQITLSYWMKECVTLLTLLSFFKKTKSSFFKKMYFL